MVDFYTWTGIKGNKLHVKGYKNNKPFLETIDYKPTLYVPSDKQEQFTTVFGAPLKKLECKTIYDAKDLADTNNVYGIWPANLQYVLNNIPSENYDISLIRVHYVDIEVSAQNAFPKPQTPNYPVTCITSYDSILDLYFVFTVCDIDPNLFREELADDDLLKKVKINKFQTESLLLQSWLNFTNKANPDVITGWNSSGYDLPYLYFRCEKLGIVFDKISPFKNTSVREYSNGWGSTSYKISISGISDIDYRELYLQAAGIGVVSGVVDSTKLDDIAFKEIKKRKKEFSGDLWDLYTQNPSGFAAYNVYDVYLVVEINRKLNLLGNMYGLAYTYSCNYEDTFATVKPWECLIAKHLFNKNMLPHTKREEKPDESYEGAYVKVPNPGMKSWITSVDINSSYPHQIIQYNMSPETIVDTFFDVSLESIIDGNFVVLEQGICASASGHCFKTDTVGFLPELMSKLYSERKVHQKRMKELKKDQQQIQDEMKKRGLL